MAWYNPVSWDWGAAKDKVLGEGTIEIDPNKARAQSGDYIRDTSKTMISDIMGRQAPQADRTVVGNVSQMDTGRSDQFRQQQLGLTNRLSDIMMGNRAGAGELAARRMGERAQAQQLAMAASQRGGNAALAARQAARGVADVSQQTAGQAQQAALQDQQAAAGLLGQVSGQARGQDLSTAAQNMSAQNQRIFQQAGLDQATSLANMQARLQMMGMNDQAVLGFLSQMFGVDAAEMQARLQQDNQRIAQRDPGLLGDLIAAGGTVAGAYAGS